MYRASSKKMANFSNLSFVIFLIRNHPCLDFQFGIYYYFLCLFLPWKATMLRVFFDLNFVVHSSFKCKWLDDFKSELWVSNFDKRLQHIILSSSLSSNQLSKKVTIIHNVATLLPSMEIVLRLIFLKKWRKTKLLYPHTLHLDIKS